MWLKTLSKPFLWDAMQLRKVCFTEEVGFELDLKKWVDWKKCEIRRVLTELIYLPFPNFLCMKTYITHSILLRQIIHKYIKYMWLTMLLMPKDSLFS